MSPLISICIPTYNQTQYLKKTLDSILNQTFIDYEIIVTDDSRDNKVEDLIKRYNLNDKLQYHRNKTTLGSPQNWNEALKFAKGKYIKIMHHDDWFTYNNSLEIMVAEIQKNGADFIFCNSINFKKNKKNNFTHRPDKRIFQKIKRDSTNLFYGNEIGAPSATLFKKELNINFDINLKWIVDIDFYIQYLRKNPNIFYIDQDLISLMIETGENVTKSCLNKDVELTEYFYLYFKIKDKCIDKNDNKYSKFLASLLIKYKIDSEKEVQEYGYISKIPLRFSILIFLNKISNYLAIIAYKGLYL